MKKKTYLLAGICILLCMLSVGCGQEDYMVGRASLEYYDISVTAEELFEGRKKDEENGVLLGMQYYQGEPIQIWLFYEEEQDNIYLCRTDGSRELLQENVNIEDFARWYIDEEGGIYCWKRSLGMQQEEAPYIRKLDGEGRELFRKQLEQGVLLWDLCQLEDGRIMILLQDGQGGDMKLAELNPVNGSFSEKPGVRLGQSLYAKYIAAGSKGVLVLDREYPAGITEINMKDGSVFSAISFSGTSYSLEDGLTEMEIQGFRMQEEGGAEILWADPVSGRSICETLSLTKMEKIPVILQTTFLMDGGWLEERAGEFNRSDSNYQVIVEYPDSADQVDFGTRLALQMAAGKGPDILYGYALDYVEDLAEKGGLEDLAPYMAESGIREEDYYPYAFSYWREGEKIYTFRMSGMPSFSCIRKELLGGRDVSDIETLLDALLDWEGEAFLTHFPASKTVMIHFYDSKDFWGMIDWENGTCDFSGELFEKILKVAKKYGVTYERAVAGDFPTGRMLPIESIRCSFYGYKTSAELEKMGLVKMDSLLGDESGGIGDTYAMLAVNAHSAQKDGAWEFIRYLMSESVQSTFTDGDMVNKQAHRKWIEHELARLKKVGSALINPITAILSNGETIIDDMSGSYYTREDITEERIEEYIEMLENTSKGSEQKAMPLGPVYDIISEEAEYYFEDVKSLEEVVDIINSRVGMYVGEQH